MAGSAKRERQLAREHYERQQARRAERASKQRRNRVATRCRHRGSGARGGRLGALDPARRRRRHGDRRLDVLPLGQPAGLRDADPHPDPVGDRRGRRLHVHEERNRRQGRRPAGVRREEGGELQEALHGDHRHRPGRRRGRHGRRQGAAAPRTASSTWPRRSTSTTRPATASPRRTSTCCSAATRRGTGSGGPGYQFGEENLPAEGQNNVPRGHGGDGQRGCRTPTAASSSWCTRTPPCRRTTRSSGTSPTGWTWCRRWPPKGVEGGGNDGAPAQKVTIKNVTVGEG